MHRPRGPQSDLEPWTWHPAAHSRLLPVHCALAHSGPLLLHAFCQEPPLPSLSKAISAPPDLLHKAPAVNLLCPGLGAFFSGAGPHWRDVCLALTPVSTVSSLEARLWPLLGLLPTSDSWGDAQARGTAQTLAELNSIFRASLPPAGVTCSRTCCLGWCQPLLLGGAHGEEIRLCWAGSGVAGPIRWAWPQEQLVLSWALGGQMSSCLALALEQRGCGSPTEMAAVPSTFWWLH